MRWQCPFCWTWIESQSGSAINCPNCWRMLQTPCDRETAALPRDYEHPLDIHGATFGRRERNTRRARRRLLFVPSLIWRLVLTGSLVAGIAWRWRHVLMP